MEALGRHLLIEMLDCDHDLLDDVQFVTDAMEEGARRAHATIVTSNFHRFNPHGVSGTVVIAESHLAIHTWPEYGYAAIDVFTCGEECDPYLAFEYIAEQFKAGRTTHQEFQRGKLGLNGRPLLHKPAEVESTAGV